MNRWSRIVLSIGCLATLAWIGAGLLGYRVESQPTLALHTLVSFAALLALLLAHAWVATFALVAAARLRARAATAPAAFRGVVRSGRLAAGAALVAIVSALLLFTVSNALFPARLPPRTHALAAGLSALVLLAAWGVEVAALGRHGREVTALDGAAS